MSIDWATVKKFGHREERKSLRSWRSRGTESRKIYFILKVIYTLTFGRMKKKKQ